MIVIICYLFHALYSRKNIKNIYIIPLCFIFSRCNKYMYHIGLVHCQFVNEDSNKGNLLLSPKTSSITMKTSAIIILRKTNSFCAQNTYISKAFELLQMYSQIYSSLISLLNIHTIKLHSSCNPP